MARAKRNIGQEILDGLRELKSGEHGRVINVPDVASIRARTGLSQARLAVLLGVSVRTLQDWERGRRASSGAARTLLMPRGLERTALGQVIDLGWIAEHLNVLITGPTGVGKSYIGCAVGHAACRADYSVRFFRIPRLTDELARYAALQNKSTLLRQIAKADLLIIDFGLAPLAESVCRDLLEILDDRYDRRSTLITSQIPVEQWHAYLQDPTIADAILDRLIHNSYRLTLKGESMRKQKTTLAARTAKVR
jgi:transcriptional regulator with XRE-family HTH domain